MRIIALVTGLFLAPTIVLAQGASGGGIGRSFITEVNTRVGEKIWSGFSPEGKPCDVVSLPYGVDENGQGEVYLEIRYLGAGGNTEEYADFVFGNGPDHLTTLDAYRPIGNVLYAAVTDRAYNHLRPKLTIWHKLVMSYVGSSPQMLLLAKKYSDPTLPSATLSCNNLRFKRNF
jgi:hypothetical protein